MAVFNEPTKWAQTLGKDADVTTIPDTAGDTDPSIDKIFPSVFSIPLAQGGKAIPRSVLNGLFKLLGDWVYYIQNGGVSTYSESFDYVAGRVVSYNGNIYKCIQANGVSSTVVAPDSGTEYWQRLDNFVRSVNGVNADASGNIAITSVANATKATQDSEGNVIANTYVKKTGNETISGVKTFTGTINTNGFIGFKSTQDGIGGGFANYLNNNKVCDVWGQPSGANKDSLIHLRIKDYQSDDNLAYLMIGGNNKTKQGSIAFNGKNLVRSVNGVNADVNGNVELYDYVIESVVNSNGSWYRKWKSGWLEQGGTENIPGPGPMRVNLLVPFTNTLYNVQATIKHESSAIPTQPILVHGFSTTSFLLDFKDPEFTEPAMWYAYGMGA